MNLGVLIFSLETENISEIRSLFTDFKQINAKDHHFCYTCICETGTTMWLFGYSDPKIKEEADEYIQNYIQNLYNFCKAKPSYDVLLLVSSNNICQCPFR
jgi:hypothetical protein